MYVDVIKFFKSCVGFSLPNRQTSSSKSFSSMELFLTAAGLDQLVERFTAERKVMGSISGAGPILSVLK